MKTKKLLLSILCFCLLITISCKKKPIEKQKECGCDGPTIKEVSNGKALLNYDILGNKFYLNAGGIFSPTDILILEFCTETSQVKNLGNKAQEVKVIYSGKYKKICPEDEKPGFFGYRTLLIDLTEIKLDN